MKDAVRLVAADGQKLGAGAVDFDSVIQDQFTAGQVDVPSVERRRERDDANSATSDTACRRDPGPLSSVFTTVMPVTNDWSAVVMRPTPLVATTRK